MRSVRDFFRASDDSWIAARWTTAAQPYRASASRTGRSSGAFRAAS